MMNRLVLTSSALLLLLLCVCVDLSQSSPVRCCTMYSPQPFPVNRLTDYTLQDATMTCNIEAVIFTTVKNRQICANPEDLWVQRAMTHIQTRKSS